LTLDQFAIKVADNAREETTMYLHFGFDNEPRQTVKVQSRHQLAPRKGQTQSGYGAAMPSDHMVKYNGRWRRVYVANHGNAGTAYIGKPGAWLATVSN
jgi:hypothetical protein